MESHSTEALMEFFRTLQPSMDRSRLRMIAGLFSRKEVASGSMVIKQNSVCNLYSYVEQGVLRSFTTNYEGTEITTGIFSSGKIMSDLSSFFTRKPAAESFVAMSDCVLHCLSFEELQTAFHSMPEFRELGRAILVSEYARLKQRMLSGLHLKAEERYAQLLKNNPDVFKHVPLKQVASYLGITDSSLSRIRREFVQK